MLNVNKEYLSYYTGKNILITGGLGYLGSAVIKTLSSVKCHIIALDSKESNSGALHKGLAEISLKYADVRKKDTWQEFIKDVDIIFHFAAQTSSYFSNKEPLKDAEINLFPVVNFIESCLETNKRPQIIFSGTATEVGLTEIYPVNETFADKPVTVYDINKLASEKYLQYYSRGMGGKSAILRLANVYGPGIASSSQDRGVVNAMIKKALNRQTLTIYGEGDFIRDYVYIDDVIDAFLTAGAHIEAINGNYYVLGTGVGHSIKDMVRIVNDEVVGLTNHQVETKHISAPADLSPIETRNFIADPSLFRKATGWKTNVSLKDGIRRTAEYFLKQEGLT